MRSVFKRAVERGLVAGGIAGLSRIFRSPSRLVLAYHNVVPAGELPAGERALHLTQEMFAAHLDVLSATCEVVPLAALLQESDDAPNRPRVAITFDDAYRGALTAGIDELSRRALPSTVFVVPGLLEEQAFWWDALADPSSGLLSPAVRDTALGEWQGRNDQVLERAGRTGAAVTPPSGHARSGSERLLDAVAAQSAAITFASHGWSHANLTRLAPADCAEELERSREWLAARYGNFRPWLAYPYGLHSPAIEALAAETGYEAAFAISGGWIRPGTVDPYRLPRLNVPAGMSADGLRLRLAGLFHR